MVETDEAESIFNKLLDNQINVFHQKKGQLKISFDETKTVDDVLKLLSVLGVDKETAEKYLSKPTHPHKLARKSELFREDDIFKRKIGELEMMRFIQEQ